MEANILNCTTQQRLICLCQLSIVLIASVVLLTSVHADSSGLPRVRQAIAQLSVPSEAAGASAQLRQEWPEEEVVNGLAETILAESATWSAGKRQQVFGILSSRNGAKYAKGVDAFIFGLTDTIVAQDAIQGLQRTPDSLASQMIPQIMDFLETHTNDPQLFRLGAGLIIQFEKYVADQHSRLHVLAFDTTLSPQVRVPAIESWFRSVGLKAFLEQLPHNDSIFTLGALRAFAGSGMKNNAWLVNSNTQDREGMAHFVLLQMESNNPSIRESAVSLGPTAIAGLWYYKIKDPAARPYVDSTIMRLEKISQTDATVTVREAAARSIEGTIQIRDRMASSLDKEEK